MENDFIHDLVDRVVQLDEGTLPKNWQFIVVNVNSPITVNSDPQQHVDWLGHALHAFEGSSVRIAVCVISFFTLLGVVGYKVGFMPHADSVIVERAPVVGLDPTYPPSPVTGREVVFK
ncbi:MAG: hypothetical protein ABI995_10210 [Acidobacteriota bacterium]